MSDDIRLEQFDGKDFPGWPRVCQFYDGWEIVLGTWVRSVYSAADVENQLRRIFKPFEVVLERDAPRRATRVFARMWPWPWPRGQQSSGSKTIPANLVEER